ncbi:hypothetical protein m07a_01890 [Bartonella schoenbuchensis m07a]|uniref:Right handed beta helix domain-containing protein n=2 Tax=Bartonella schoenbuchensis TaxID=165694 RepID=N6URE3_9HYPH|nr:hypothetical protein m07a_01890 [Bartonella schoenbuchensis m07a]
MVMRCVLKHHVCLCVLSTAVLAGLALITAQTKVYAQSKNCNGIANPGASRPGSDSDSPKGKIECDGSDGRGKKINTLSGNRTIDMGTESNKPAVKVHNGADITIVSDTLIITDSSQSKSTSPAIQVESGGKLMLAGNVDIKDVKKGIVADGKGSSVTVNRGKIGVRANGDAVIEVKNGGEVTLNRGVTVSGGGIVVGEGGGTVTLMGTNFTRVRNGIVFMGDKGTANVIGVGGATINLADGNSTGVIMQGREGANATVMSMTINGGRGSMGTTGAEVTDGTLELNRVNISEVEMGARVTKGKLTVMGGEIQASGTGGTGAEVTGSGVVMLMGKSTITVGRSGTGLRVTGSGSVNMVGGSIQASGGDGMTGVIVNTSGDVTLSGGVKIAGTTMGLRVAGGSATMMGGKITGGGNGAGVTGTGGDVTLEGITISGVGTGVSMEGTGRLTMNNVTIKGEDNGYGVNASGEVTLTEVKISQVQMGVSMEGTGGKLIMIGGSVKDFTGNYGVSVGENVTSAELKGVEIEGKNRWYGHGGLCEGW